MVSHLYDVFLSFRGFDTRYNFTGHLDNALKRRGIDSFIDDKLRRGDDITALFDKIEQSKIAIIVFSKNYANSAWCLRELVKILECRERNKLVVVPIFYKVDKSELVKVLKESFTEVTEDEIVSWEAALTTAVNISGYVVNEFRYALYKGSALMSWFVLNQASSSCLIARLRPNLWMILLLTHSMS